MNSTTYVVAAMLRDMDGRSVKALQSINFRELASPTVKYVEEFCDSDDPVMRALFMELLQEQLCDSGALHRGIAVEKNGLSPIANALFSFFLNPCKVLLDNDEDECGVTLETVLLDYEFDDAVFSGVLKVTHILALCKRLVRDFSAEGWEKEVEEAAKPLRKSPPGFDEFKKTKEKEYIERGHTYLQLMTEWGALPSASKSAWRAIALVAKKYRDWGVPI